MGIGRLLSSTVARLVVAIFALQVLSGAAAIVLLRTQMIGIVSADRTREVLDVRDDLLAEYYSGGRPALARAVAARAGSLSDPLIYIALAGGGGPDVLSHAERLSAVAPGNAPVPTQVWHEGLPTPVEGLSLATDLADGTRLTVGTVTTPDRRFDAAFAEAITLTVVLTAALALVGALLIGYVISRRTHAIAATAEALGRGNFAARITHHDSGDGFDHLRRQINAMAERIDRLVAQLQSVSAALAHDLRSPVARLRASIDAAGAAAHCANVPAELTEALALVQTDAEALDRMLADALELSRLESGALADRRARQDLSVVAGDLAELYEPLVEQHGAALALDLAPAWAEVDRELLARALSNLVDNALKYGGKSITLGTGREGGNPVVWVADDGPGIAEGDRGRAFERHTRLDNARTKPGAGLGLAVVAAVARLHDGRLELGAAGALQGGGLLAKIILPGA